jgi:type I restriction enzyme R subunit
MFVCSNRTIAYNLYKKIVALRPEWAKLPTCNTMSLPQYGMVAEPLATYGNAPLPIERIKLVMTRNKDDEQELYDLLGPDEDRKKLDIQFKNPKSNFKIAIVVDMWITGFDVPCLDTMYIDKPLQQHTLVQTISRVNRVYPGKDKGLVVDYIGIKNNMNTALKRYATGETDADSVETIEQFIAMVKDELDILRRMFAKYDYKTFSTGSPLEQLDSLNKGAEFAQTTLSPTFTLSTPSEIFSTIPANSWPKPEGMFLIKTGCPLRKVFTSVPQVSAASTFTRISPLLRGLIIVFSYLIS